MRYDRDHKQATRERILAKAGRVFREQGFAGASVDRIMRAAGLTVGGFYAHFESKEALFREALGTLLTRHRDRLLGGLDELAGARWLEHVAHRYLSPDNRDSADGCAMPSVLSELTRSGPELQRALADALAPFAREIEARAGPGPGELDARQRALATISLLFGALTLARATSALPLSEEILRAARAFLGAYSKNQ